MEKNKDKKTSTSGRLQLKKTINAGQIKQSFSHGRSRSVSVEVKKRRTLTGFSKDEIIEQPKSTETDSENNFLSRKDSNLGKNESDETKNLDEINEKDEKKVILIKNKCNICLIELCLLQINLEIKILDKMIRKLTKKIKEY
jgi:hypothetical protein